VKHCTRANTTSTTHTLSSQANPQTKIESLFKKEDIPISVDHEDIHPQRISDYRAQIRVVGRIMAMGALERGTRVDAIPVPHHLHMASPGVPPSVLLLVPPGWLWEPLPSKTS
jgi:hypothetical protein